MSMVLFIIKFILRKGPGEFYQIIGVNPVVINNTVITRRMIDVWGVLIVNFLDMPKK